MVNLSMAITVILDSKGEEIVAAHLRSGRYHSPEEVVTCALENFAGAEPAPSKRTVAEAVAHIRESRKGVTLDGLRIKDLAHEGHKY